MVLIDLFIDETVIQVDPLLLIWCNDFWLGFFKFESSPYSISIPDNIDKDIFIYYIKYIGNTERNYSNSILYHIKDNFGKEKIQLEPLQELFSVYGDDYHVEELFEYFDIPYEGSYDLHLRVYDMYLNNEHNEWFDSIEYLDTTTNQTKSCKIWKITRKSNSISMYNNIMTEEKIIYEALSIACILCTFYIHGVIEYRLMKKYNLQELYKLNSELMDVITSTYFHEAFKLQIELLEYINVHNLSKIDKPSSDIQNIKYMHESYLSSNDYHKIINKIHTATYYCKPDLLEYNKRGFFSGKKDEVVYFPLDIFSRLTVYPGDIHKTCKLLFGNYTIRPTLNSKVHQELDKVVYVCSLGYINNIDKYEFINLPKVGDERTLFIEFYFTKFEDEVYKVSCKVLITKFDIEKYPFLKQEGIMIGTF